MGDESVGAVLLQLRSSVPPVEGVGEALELDEVVKLATTRPILATSPSVPDDAFGFKPREAVREDHGRWWSDGRTHMWRTLAMRREFIKWMVFAIRQCSGRSRVAVDAVTA